ncbi:hypothetical protein HMPREF0650_2120 [Hoylesella buccalis ATCC 35310]|uniref:Uncharacterized protein n=1 Tax=Hoylesella buccalis ATCC 35310 TaxID=679190 RepID=D1W3I0_9BACT|nr:hypothetical protein HMPREF0650_2120 [Hoylesella buccalis ATCC 35310]
MAESSKYLFLSKCLACIEVSVNWLNNLKRLCMSVKIKDTNPCK